MNKICVIYQPYGLGDILFLQKYAHIQRSKGYKIYWPIMKDFKWINDYISDIHFIPFPNNSDFFLKNKNDFTSLNIFEDDFIFYDGFHHVAPGNRIMAYKYESVGIDYKDWASYVIFKRSIEKEKYLFYDILKLKDNKPYVFVNRMYGTKPNRLKSDKVIIPKNLPIVEMDVIDGISIFDWCKVIENASEIHMIETSLNYVMESPIVKPNLKANVLKLYTRHTHHSFVDYLLNIKWEFMLCG